MYDVFHSLSQSDKWNDVYKQAKKELDAKEKERIEEREKFDELDDIPF